MTITEKCLYSLLSMGLGVIDRCEIPPDIDWAAIEKLSSEQGVSGIILDCLQKAIDDDIVRLDSIERGVLIRLISAALSYENNYKLLRAVYEYIDKALKKSNLSCLQLKGFSIAKEYPMPSRRYFSDIDIYSPFNHYEVDLALRKMGGIKGSTNFRHSQTFVHNCSVENHQYVTDIKGRNDLKLLEKKLNDLAVKDLGQCDELGIVNPSFEFNSLFNIYHSHYHFIYETISLKYICDWTLFLKNHHQEIEENNTVSKWQYYGLLPFAAVMTSIAEKYMGLSKEIIPDELNIAIAHIPSHIEERTLHDILYPSSRPRKEDGAIIRGLHIAKHVFNNRWKIEYFCGQNVYSFLWSKGLSVLFGKDSGFID